MNQDSEGLTHVRILQLSEMTAIEHKIDYTHAATDSKYSDSTSSVSRYHILWIVYLLQCSKTKPKEIYSVS